MKTENTIRYFVDADDNIIGVSKLTEDGWKFCPQVDGKKARHKCFPTWEESVPGWARSMILKSRWTKTSRKDYVARWKEQQKAAGKRRISLWLHPEDIKSVRDYAAKLTGG